MVKKEGELITRMKSLVPGGVSLSKGAIGKAVEAHRTGVNQDVIGAVILQAGITAQVNNRRKIGLFGPFSSSFETLDNEMTARSRELAFKGRTKK